LTHNGYSSKHRLRLRRVHRIDVEAERLVVLRLLHRHARLFERLVVLGVNRLSVLRLERDSEQRFFRIGVL
jgi:hypothetical protein